MFKFCKYQSTKFLSLSTAARSTLLHRPARVELSNHSSYSLTDLQNALDPQWVKISETSARDRHQSMTD